MTVVLPRLDRPSAGSLLDRYRHERLEAISASMPDRAAPVTYPAVGGARIDLATLEQLRRDVLRLAGNSGMPGPIHDIAAFEGHGARLLRQSLHMTPHEASHEEVWTYLTCCWLLDVAVWRFGGQASTDRFIGHINRNTFRRMWWREEILGTEVDLTRLGEDELVNIMERPTLYADRRLARAVARVFLHMVDEGLVRDRMRLMREGTKRLLRLTPFLAFPALKDAEIEVVVWDAFEAALLGLAGQVATMPQRTSETPPEASPEVEAVVVLTTGPERPGLPNSADRPLVGIEELARAAVDIAQKTGRVTNAALREAAPITSGEARGIFELLLDRGQVVKRGRARGTYYTIPEAPPDTGDDVVSDVGDEANSERIEVSSAREADQHALRRVLRRGRP